MRCVLLLGLLTGVSARDFMKAKAFRNIAHHPEMKESKNVCISVKDACSGKMKQAVDDESGRYLAKNLNIRPIPSDFDGKLFETALLLTRANNDNVDGQQTAFAHSSEEWSEAMIPVFDLAADLKKKIRNAGSDEGLFSAVVMPQVPNAAKFMSSSFDVDVLESLLDTSGSTEKAEKMFCEDVKKQKEVCFNRLIHYRHVNSKEPSRAAAKALRKRANLQDTVAPKRKAVLVIRKDHMGWINYVDVEAKLRALLASKCWDVAQVEHTNAPVQQAMDDLKDADLVIANHGPHNDNLIWMSQKAGFIEDKNCKCADYGHENLANQQGLRYAISGADGTPEECQQLLKKGQGLCAMDKPRVVDFENEIQPAVLSMIEELEQERLEVPKTCATDL